MILEPQPLQGVLGQDLHIYCIISPSGVDDLLLLVDNVIIEGDRVSDRIINGTHREYILSELTDNDQGKQFTCGYLDLRSPVVAVQILSSKLCT